MPDKWLLLDYGQVLSTAPPDDEWGELRKAAGPVGSDPARFDAVYWEHRGPYDRADLTVEEYWAIVAPTGDLDEMRRLDVAIWLHPHRPSVDAAHRAGRQGWRLAILSNAPVEVAQGIDRLDWIQPFEHRFYSCDLKAIKPDPTVYLEVLHRLGAAPADVVFFDDRPDNVAAAAALGIDARHFTEAAQLDAV